MAKTFRILFMLVIAVVICCDRIEPIEDGFYWYEGEKIPLQKMDGKFYMVFYAPEESKIKNEFAKAGIELYGLHAIRDWSSFVAPGKAYPGAEKLTGLMVAFADGRYEKAATALSSTIYWSPFYKLDNGSEIMITQLFTVVLKSGTRLDQLERLAEENSVVMIGVDEYNPEYYYLACTNLSRGNALEMANLLYDSGLFEQAFPDFTGGGWLDYI